ncbi:MAG: hypothetical protein U0165_17740 [Polyangiaceae bacterium]
MPILRSHAARSLFYYGIYVGLCAAGLLFFPVQFLGPFGFEPPREIWIRVVGVMLVSMAMFNIRSALGEVRQFFSWSIPARMLVIVFFAAFVLADWAPAKLVLFGVVDFAGAVWTWWAMKRDSALVAPATPTV